jgi:hypothetical protein
MAGALWCSVVVLVLVGVTAAFARVAFPSDLATRMEPLRQQLLDALRLHDPLAAQRGAELARFDGTFAAHRLATMLHVVPGALFLLLAPLQFVSHVRDRYLNVHRWLGRLSVLAAWVSGLVGLYFGLFTPYAGGWETIAIALFGGLFVAAVSIGLVAIRRGEVARHREWMIRAFATAIGISTVRIVGGVLDVALTPAGVGPQAAFLISIWIGWIVTVSAAEIWIVRTRLATTTTGTAESTRPVSDTSASRRSGSRRRVAPSRPPSRHAPIGTRPPTS